VECLTAGTIGNVAIGAININLNSIAFIASVSNPEPAQGGENAETESDFLARASSEYAQHKMLVREADFSSAVDAIPGVLRAVALATTSFTAPSTFTSPAPGKVTILAMPNDGGTLTSLLKTQILDGIKDRLFIDLQANDYVYIADFQRSVITVACTVKKLSGTDANVIASISATLTSFLDPKTWIPGKAVNFIEVGALITNLPLVDVVTALTINGGSAAIALTAQTVAQLNPSPVITVT
jgi:Baseplate J-like protein